MSADDRRPEPGALIDLPSLPNLRDIGGYPVASGGRVRSGLLYRSVGLNRLAPDDAESLEQLGIRTVFDLRTEAERSSDPDRLPEGARGVVCDVLADSSHAAPAQMLELIDDPARASRDLGDGKAASLFEDAYRQIVSSSSALRAYGDLFTGIADADARPVLFHCTTGKDRTGWAAAALLMLLGVDRRHVFHDYELTNRDLLPRFDDLIERFASDGGDPDVLRAVLGVDPAYLRTAIDEMETRFGSVSGYFRDGLGIDDAAQRDLRRALTRTI